jgi:hypothetical protein
MLLKKYGNTMDSSLIKKKHKKISFDEVLRLKPPKFNEKIKTKKKVIKEFNIDKWGALLKFITKFKKIDISKLDKIYFSNNQIQSPVFYSGNFYLANSIEKSEIEKKIICDYVIKNTNDIDNIVELGAGYGSKILYIAKYLKNKKIKKNIFALEYTNNGRNLIKKISKSMNLEIVVGKCDLNKKNIFNLKFKNRTLFFTSFSLHYCKKINKEMINFFFKNTASKVIHFEPCYEAKKRNKDHEMICRDYIEKNNYTKNILSEFLKAQAKKKILLTVKRNVFGENCYLPFSIIKYSKYK